ncbi:MAG: HEPN domain-containing protein [Treponema sp.]|nr:HEPN domain-containing protein [Treponema sp.]
MFVCRPVRQNFGLLCFQLQQAVEKALKGLLIIFFYKSRHSYY